MENRIFVFAWNKDFVPNHVPYLGYYDGKEYHQRHYDENFNALEELKKYDYVEMFGVDGRIIHRVKPYRNLLRDMHDAYIYCFGDEVSLF